MSALLRRSLRIGGCRTTARASAIAVSTVPGFDKVPFEPELLPSVSVVSDSPAGWQGDLLAVAVTEDDLTSSGGDQPGSEKTVSINSEALAALNNSLQGVLGELLSGGDFEAKQGTASKAIRLAGSSAAGPKYVALLGLGKAEALAKPSAEQWGASPFQAAGAALAKLAKAEKATSAGLAIIAPLDEVQQQEAASSIAAGVLSGCYEYLVEAPPNVCTPSHLAEAAEFIAAKAPDTFSLEYMSVLLLRPSMIKLESIVHIA
eukprot:gene7401-7610_t